MLSKNAMVLKCSPHAIISSVAGEPDMPTEPKPQLTYEQMCDLGPIIHDLMSLVKGKNSHQILKKVLGNYQK